MDENFTQLEYRKTFTQRNGFEPIPAPLQPEEISQQLRLELEDLLLKETQKEWNRPHGCKIADWHNILGDIWVQFFKKPRFATCQDLCIQECTRLICFGGFHEVFTVMEELAVRVEDKQPSFQDEINHAFVRNQVPYILYKSPEKKEWIIIQTGSGKERESVLQCLADIGDPAFSKTREHFEKSGHNLNKGEFPESVGQSTKALEACLRTLTHTPDSSGGQVLKIFDNEIKLSPGIKQIISAVWQYRNEAEDVGHSKKDNTTSPPPDRWDAQLIYVVIAGILSFLVNKYRDQNQLG